MIGIGCLPVYIILVLILLIPLLFAQMITGAFVTLGFSPNQALFLLIASFIGSFMNLPIKKWPEVYIPQERSTVQLTSNIGHYFIPKNRFLAINIGGAIIPGAVSIWEIYRILTYFSDSYPNAFLIFLVILTINTIICYKIARTVPGKGIAIPAFIPPLTVSILSLLLIHDIAPVIAFPSGVLGVLIGADILHLKEIKYSNAQIGSIGGAGTFDGIFLCGILSVFLTR